MPPLPPSTRARRGIRFTRNTLLLGAAIVATLLNVPFWWNIQSALTSSVTLAAMMTIGCVLIPPILLSLLFPWTPAGALVAKFNAKLPGNFLVVGASLWFVYYGYTMQEAYWTAQPAGAQGHAWSQAILGMVVGYVIPTLAWGMVGVSDLADELRQIQLVRKYEMEADAQLAFIRSQVYRAQELAARGLAELTTAERQELAAILPALFEDMERSRQEIGQHVHRIAQTDSAFALHPNPDRQHLLGYYSAALTGEFEDSGDVRP
jgi:uncharacterized protein YqgC (DUF456 family)